MDTLTILKKLTNKTDLTEAEASFVLGEIVSGRTTTSQIAALLTSLKMKGETTEEILGLLKAMKKNMITLAPKATNLIDTCGTGGDGSGSFNISTATAFVAAGAGCNVAKHGNRSASGKTGSADVLEELGVKLYHNPEVLEFQLDTIGLAFLYAPLFHPAMKNIAPIRKELGFKTVFNLVGPLLNPANVQRQILGVSDEKIMVKLAQVLVELNTKFALVVHSNGMDEIGLGVTKVIEISNGNIENYHIDAADFGFENKHLSKVNNPKESAEIILLVLSGKKGPERDVVVLNSAAAIYASGKVGSIKEGIELAQDSIDSGKAMKKLDELRSFNVE